MTPTPPQVAPLASLLVRSGELKGRRLPVKVPMVNIGRADYNDVVLADPSVSTSHAKLQRRDDVWVLSDWARPTGRSWRASGSRARSRSSPGTTVRFGEVAVLFEPFDEPAPVRRYAERRRESRRCRRGRAWPRPTAEAASPERRPIRRRPFRGRGGPSRRGLARRSRWSSSSRRLAYFLLR